MFLRKKEKERERERKREYLNIFEKKSTDKSCFPAGWAPEQTAKVGERERRDELIQNPFDPLFQHVPDVWSKKVAPPHVLPAFTAAPSSPCPKQLSWTQYVHWWQIGTLTGSCFAQLISFGKSGGYSQTVGQVFSRE